MLSFPPALRLLDRMCRALYRSASHVSVLSDGFRRTLIERGVSPDRISVIYNWCDEASMRGAPETAARRRAEMGWDGRLVVMFAGTMGLAQGLDTVLDAAARCATEVPQALFAFVGGGVERERLVRAAREHGLANVTFVERQPSEAMAGWLAAAAVPHHDPVQDAGVHGCRPAHSHGCARRRVSAGAGRRGRRVLRF